MNCYKTVGGKLKQLREIKEIKQIEMASILKIKQSYYSQLESGNKEISLEKLVKIADEFDIPLDWFVGRDTTISRKIKEQNQ